MSFGSSPKAPAPPPLLPQSAQAPSAPSQGKRRPRSVSSQTILTSGQGDLSEATTNKKSLLGG